ncbi:MAG TPA: IS630 family transposase [Candidatus Babeliales bacterium]|nr:IS630 family transposase [Candidatus Babeliales bacterium]
MVIHQKKTFKYAEANQQKRELFLEEIRDIDPALIVYSDETGIDDNEVPRTGWSPKGERCHAVKRAERKTRYNITAALNLNILFAPFIFEGYSNASVYETYVERILAPALKPGMVLIIDNASFHKSKKVIQLIEAVNCRVIFLPPYSPDFNPIEHHWHSVKHAIKTAAEVINDFYEAAVQTLGTMCTI